MGKGGVREEKEEKEWMKAEEGTEALPNSSF